MKPLTGISKALAGKCRLPAGAVPLASEHYADMICLMPLGIWIEWWPADALLKQRAFETQKEVMAVLIDQLGGTTVTMSKKLGISPRTVESWKQGKSPLPISKAYEIAEMMSNITTE